MIKEFLYFLYLGIEYLAAWVALRLGYKNILKRETWLVSEKKTEARDNGYHMFKFLQSTNVKANSYYAIVTTSRDYRNIKNHNNVVEYNSFFHIALYLGSRYILASNYDAKPYESLRGICRLEIFRRKNQLKVNLTHGICKDNIPSAYDFRLAGYQLFICGAKPEYEYYKELYHYPDDNIALTGLCRFDSLQNTASNKIVLLMPTFREWLRTDDSSKIEASIEEKEMMKKSSFFARYCNLLNDPNLLSFLELNDAHLYFYLHYTIQPYNSLFEANINNPYVTICDRASFDVQDLLKKSTVLITDYSSVAFDFAYMRKPLAYFQFDYNEYREKHYKEGFFSYEKDGLGPVFENEEDIVSWLPYAISVGAGSWNYLNRCDSFFPFSDKNNCERVYNAILKLSRI